MKEKELTIKDVMCGDWIDVRNDAAPNTPHLERITPSHFLRDEHWYGIEITPEILGKNEFKRDPLWHHCDRDLGNYSISVQLGYANKIEYIRIAEKGEDNVIPSERTKMYLTKIKYVHQLQRIMRFIGCKKEIIL